MFWLPHRDRMIITVTTRIPRRTVPLACGTTDATRVPIICRTTVSSWISQRKIHGRNMCQLHSNEFSEKRTSSMNYRIQWVPLQFSLIRCQSLLTSVIFVLLLCPANAYLSTLFIRNKSHSPVPRCHRMHGHMELYVFYWWYCSIQMMIEWFALIVTFIRFKSFLQCPSGVFVMDSPPLSLSLYVVLCNIRVFHCFQC